MFLQCFATYFEGGGGLCRKCRSMSHALGKEFTKNHGLPSKPLYLCIGKSKKAQPITTKRDHQQESKTKKIKTK